MGVWVLNPPAPTDTMKGKVLLFLSCLSVGGAEDCGDESPFYLDGWERAHGLTDWFGDPDSDGIANYVEFGFGTDPFDASGMNGAAGVNPEIRVSPEGHLQIVIRQPDTGSCAQFPTYGRPWFWISVDHSTDLQSWKEIALKPGMNDGFRPREGFKIIENRLDEKTWEIVIEQEALAASQGVGWFRLYFFIVS
jgi:hypothetical protein